MTTFINLADIVCPDDAEGRTYRQINAAKTHGIPIGALVEIVSDGADEPEDGVRLFVVHHSRDCDMTPMYYLSAHRDDTEQRVAGRKNPEWMGGYGEDSLKVIYLHTMED